MRLNEVYRNSGLGKWFHGESATKEPGWDRYNSEGKRVGKCGDAKEGSAYSACLSKQKADKLGKEGRASFVNRKRKAQSKRGRGKKGSDSKGKKPIFVKTGAAKMNEEYELNLILEGKNKPNDPEKWSACKSAAKSKFDVYPSAYANAWASKCYKKKGGTWRSVNEETVLDETKENTKLSILNNFMENAKPEFARLGPVHQRPKKFGKGGKAGTEKKRERRKGKEEAREGMYEEVNTPTLPVNTTQERIKTEIREKSKANILHLRKLMGSPNPLNTEDTPEASSGLHPSARRDIESGNVSSVRTGMMSVLGKMVKNMALAQQAEERASGASRMVERKPKRGDSGPDPSTYVTEGKGGQQPFKPEDPASVGPPIDQSIIDAAAAEGISQQGITPRIQDVFRNEARWKDQINRSISDYQNHIEDMVKRIRLRGTGSYPKGTMNPEQGT